MVEHVAVHGEGVEEDDWRVAAAAVILGAWIGVADQSVVVVEADDVFGGWVV